MVEAVGVVEVGREVIGGCSDAATNEAFMNWNGCMTIFTIR